MTDRPVHADYPLDCAWGHGFTDTRQISTAAADATRHLIASGENNSGCVDPVGRLGRSRRVDDPYGRINTQGRQPADRVDRRSKMRCDMVRGSGISLAAKSQSAHSTGSISTG